MGQPRCCPATTAHCLRAWSAACVEAVYGWCCENGAGLQHTNDDVRRCQHVIIWDFIHQILWDYAHTGTHTYTRIAAQYSALRD
eukprot:SAG22_NODE_11292_length_492_cov_0.770992_1_plen_83_part_10